ncbi:kinase-like domain-containing protein [Thamnocephalis sphaerospora]|uniref:Kinase-like domain-containing protein n=1 Tax=Thamnocephalis sphaerospora TaxID=78915 RepID=A0A4P9XJR6_9FUNG|nr:kinase-like domain-containing protein [Thamnocephalis sphaerospora]|eukprot:RKP06023.1 kinase-like domain-containing protein [Thamnocephalis sphaerospora]
MQLFSASSLLAVLVATLWISDTSCAQTTLRVPGVTIKTEHPSGAGKSFTALVEYNKQLGFMKCTHAEWLFNQEVAALNAIHNGRPSRLRMPSNIKESFVRMLGTEKADDGQHCIIFEQLDGYSMADFVKGMSEVERDDILPDIFVQIIKGLQYMHSLGWVHGDIKPDNIIISQPTQEGLPKVKIIDFDVSQHVGRYQATSFGATRGYQPPEEFTSRTLDQYKRDTWMVGATLYESLMDMPPYGYKAEKDGKLGAITKEDLIEQMQKVALRKVNSFIDVQTSNNADLIKLLYQLLRVDVSKRPYLSSLSATLLYKLAGARKKSVFLRQAWTNTATMFSRQPRIKESANSTASLPPFSA